MQVHEATTKLRALKIRVPVEVVREAVQRLRNGESVYRLHHEFPPLVAKATAKKIRDRLNDGKLSFLFEIQPEFEAAQEERTAVEEDTPDWLRHPLRGFLTKEDVREEVGRKAAAYRKTFTWFEWDIENLEAIGIPLDEALDLMVEHTMLLDRKSEWGYPDLRRYIEITQIILTCRKQSQKEYGAPLEFIKLAAATFAKGFDEWNSFLEQTSVNILRYQVWRGPKFVEAFKRAQIPTHRAARHLKRSYDEQISNMSKSAAQEDEEQTDD